MKNYLERLTSVRPSQFAVVLLLIVVSFCSATVNAATEVYSSTSTAGPAIVVGSVAAIDDPYFPQLPSNTMFSDKASAVNIRLRVNKDAITYYATKFTVTIVLAIQTQSDPNSAVVTNNVTLKVEYDPAAGVQHQDQNVFHLAGAHRVYAEVISFTAVDGNNLPIPIPQDVILDGEVNVERYYTFNTAITPSILAMTPSPGKMQISWSSIVGAEEYDLEWTIAGAEDPQGNAVPMNSIHYDFRHSASRITTTSNTYTLNLLFGKAYVVFRVRAVGRAAINTLQRIEGQWSLNAERGLVSDASTVGHEFAADFHEEYLNWRSTASYAEEGKRKEVVEYYDGTLRKRQAVTMLSTTNRTVVAESVPDNQGRMAVEILPGPTSEDVFHFYRNFNLSTATSNSYSRTDFDLPPAQCSFPPVPISPTSGAGKYYSQSNPERTVGMNAFIPDAQGYPFVQTSFALDNTNRVRAQSGAGPDHKITSSHETRYFYGTPFQEDLDRLFGASVGYSAHYKKNMTVDPNHQVSVAYLDPAGHTIATALAGAAPPGLQALSSNGGGVLRTVSLMANNRIVGEESNALNTADVSSMADPYEFSYALDPQRFTDKCAPNDCYDCVYDLTLSLKDECGTELAQNGGVTETVGTPIDTLCGPKVTLTRSFQKTLDIGSYAISKTLRLNQAAIDAYIAHYIADNTCLKTYDDFLTEYLSKVDFSGCGGDYCEAECDEDPTVNPAGQNDPGLKSHVDCLADCNASDPCEADYNVLLADVRPGGQYGAVDPDTITYILSLYNEANDLEGVGNLSPSGPPGVYGNHSWRHPFNVNGIGYHNEDGTASKVDVDGVPTNPEQLTYEDFIANWQDSWAESLVQYHPEYCFYTWCAANSASNEYDSKMFNTEKYADALAAGYLGPDPLNNTNTSQADPYYRAGGKGTGQFAQMQSEIATFGGQPSPLAPPYGIYTPAQGPTFFTMKEMAVIIVHCGKCPPATTSIADLQACVAAHPFGADPTTQDEEWEAFRDLYQTTKQGMVEAQRTADLRYPINAPPCNQWVNVIQTTGSTQSTMTWPPNYNDPNHNGSIGIFNYNGDQGQEKVDNWTSRNVYAGMQRRFPTALEAMGNPTASTDAAAGVAGAIADQCTQFADAWMTKLSGCSSNPHWTTDSVQIRLELIEVCKKGGDAQHMYGASTTAPSTSANPPHNDHSFADVLERHLGPNWVTDGCDALLIDMPLPYDHNYAGTSPDPDVCGFDAAGSGGTQCLPCDSVSAAFAQYAQTHIKPAANDGHYYEKFATFMNSHFSFNLTWLEYVDFMNKCHDSNTTLTCDSLTQTARDLATFLNAVATSKEGITAKGVVIVNNPSLASAFNGTALATALASTGYECQQPGYTTCNDPLHSFTCDPTHLHITLAGDPGTSDPHKICHCDINLTLPNTSSAFADIASLTGLRPNMADVDAADVCHGFFLTATMKNGATQIVTGHTDCFPIGRCVRTKLPCAQNLVNSTGPIFASSAAVPIGSKPNVSHGTPATSKPSQQHSGNTPLRPIAKTWSKTISVVPHEQYVFTAFIGTRNGVSSKPLPTVTLSIDGAPVTIHLIAGMHPGDRPQLEGSWQAGEKDRATIALEGRPQVILSNVSLHLANCPELCNEPMFAGPVPPDPCHDMLQNQAVFDATRAYNDYIDSVKKDFRRRYVSACMKLDKQEQFSMKFMDNEYHYTLYYFDLAGNLIQTVPPQGVVPLTSAADLQKAADHRDNPSKPAPVMMHTMKTRYFYNSLNQLVMQMTPDAGTSRFWYDCKGRLVISQSARQVPFRQYSYTRFDALGRITEVGQAVNVYNVAMTQAISRNDAALQNWIANGALTEITKTFYDAPIAGVNAMFGAAGQENLRGRVASTTYTEWGPVYRAASHFSYDFHGNVKSLIQENREMPVGHKEKRIDYNYDLISGKVNSVSYQSGQRDAFYQKYIYDADNRITDVLTSPDSVIFDHDVSYSYYLHGPLWREELGDAKVQGIDYAYTIQGWIKAVNSNALMPSHDMGGDGDASINTQRALIARDEVGCSLGYFEGDYKPIGASSFEGTGGGTAQANGWPQLYNGNISRMVTSIGSFMHGTNPSPQLTANKYDQLNRLISVDAFRDLDLATNTWGGGPALFEYGQQFSYDANGNILSQYRQGAPPGPVKMDDLHYYYLPAGTNRLDHVTDFAPDNAYPNDLDNQLAGNYKYDPSGNLIGDASENISLIEWTVSGKIKNIHKAGKLLELRYDPSGNRIEKIVGSDSTRFYVHDATGNVMATYIKTPTTFRFADATMYGSSRLGEYTPWLDLSVPLTPNVYAHERGQREYELSNHLGNVLSVITDRKIPNDASNGVNVDWYSADVVSAKDYYAFGMPMPTRDFVVKKYKHGMNGQENDDEIAGDGELTTALFWEYDSRLGRRWNVDPKAHPNFSPFSTFNDNPICNTDILGDYVDYDKRRDRRAARREARHNKEFKAHLESWEADKNTTYVFKRRENSPIIGGVAPSANFDPLRNPVEPEAGTVHLFYSKTGDGEDHHDQFLDPVGTRFTGKDHGLVFTTDYAIKPGATLNFSTNRNEDKIEILSGGKTIKDLGPGYFKTAANGAMKSYSLDELFNSGQIINGQIQVKISGCINDGTVWNYVLKSPMGGSVISRSHEVIADPYKKLPYPIVQWKTE